MKRFVYKKGKILQVKSKDGKFGYIYALSKDSFGTFFAVVKRYFSVALSAYKLETLMEESYDRAYINTFGLNQFGTYEWSHVGTIREVEYKPPVLFYGSEYTTITVVFPNGQSEYIKGPVDLIRLEDDLISKGYVQKVLWLPDDIANFIFYNTRLKWSEIKKKKDNKGLEQTP